MTKRKKKPKTKNQPTNQPFCIITLQSCIIWKKNLLNVFHFQNPVDYVTLWSLLCCWDSNSDDSLLLSKQLEDNHRIDYHHDYMQNMLLAIRYNLNLNEVPSIFILMFQTDLDVQTVVKQISKIEVTHFIHTLLKLLMPLMDKQHHNKTVPLIFSCIRPLPENWYHKICLLLHPCLVHCKQKYFQLPR